MQTRHLGDGELSVLKALWELGDATVKEVLDELQRQGQGLAYNTVQTVLGRLVQKGLVSCDKSEAAHRFAAAVDRDHFRRDRLREVMKKVYDGSAGAMAFQLVEQGNLEVGEIEQLQAMLRQLVKKKQQRKRSGRAR